jgi:hypothetical protein
MCLKRLKRLRNRLLKFDFMVGSSKIKLQVHMAALKKRRINRLNNGTAYQV